MNSQPGNTLITFKNILNVIYLGTVLLLLFNSTAKALLIRALMAVGFFQPNVTLVNKATQNERLPSVSFADKEGKSLQLDNLQGKVIFINFWATWCPPCLAEMPGIFQLYHQFKSRPNVVFIPVDVDHQLIKSDTFLQKHHWNLPLYQATGSLPPALSSASIPFTVIFDRQGKLVYSHEGTADYSSDKMVKFMEKLSR
jgi:thiol-disulfide isomerase/thioredoxin